MTGTTVNKYGETTHRCSTCGYRFVGTMRRGRPVKRCIPCQERISARIGARASSKKN